jgi:hypothetical protein
MSPLAVLSVYWYIRLVLFFQWAIGEDLRGRHEGSGPSFATWAAAWWEQGWLVLVVGMIGTATIVPIYLWAGFLTIRRLKPR